MSALSKLRQQKEVLERLIQFVLSADLISDLSLPQSEFSTSNIPATSPYDHDHLVDTTVPFLCLSLSKSEFSTSTLAATSSYDHDHHDITMGPFLLVL